MLHIRLHIGVIVGRIGRCHCCNAHQSQRDNHSKGIHQPASLQAVQSLLFTHSALRAPFIAKTPDRCDIGWVSSIILYFDSQATNVHIHNF